MEIDHFFGKPSEADIVSLIAAASARPQRPAIDAQ
jgi:hypothetical protein